MKKPALDRPISDHYCSLPCELAREPCDLCQAQRRHKANQKAQAEGKPTLTHNPFASLLKKAT